MGWASGSELAANVWDTVKDYIPEGSKYDVAKSLLRAFRGFDCDTLDEADELYEQVYRYDEARGEYLDVRTGKNRRGE